jgi:hypothetical protein
MARTKIFNIDSETTVNINTSKSNWAINYASIAERYGYDDNLMKVITKLSDAHEIQNNERLFKLCVLCHNSANKYGSRNLYASFEWFFNNYVDLIKE